MYLGAKLDLPIWNNFIESRIFYSKQNYGCEDHCKMDRTLQHNLHFLSIHHYILPDFISHSSPSPWGKKKKIPSHYLLIFQTLKSSSKWIITTTVFFSCMPLQPKLQVTHQGNIVWWIRPSNCPCPLPTMLQVACLPSKTSRMRTSYVSHTVHAILHAPKCD